MFLFLTSELEVLRKSILLCKTCLDRKLTILYLDKTQLLTASVLYNIESGLTALATLQNKRCVQTKKVQLYRKCFEFNTLFIKVDGYIVRFRQSL